MNLLKQHVNNIKDFFNLRNESQLRNLFQLRKCFFEPIEMHGFV